VLKSIILATWEASSSKNFMRSVQAGSGGVCLTSYLYVRSINWRIFAV
jgi:hypothetical protein